MAGFACGTLTDPDGPTVVWAAGQVDPTVAARLGAEIEPRLTPGLYTDPAQAKAVVGEH